MKIQADSQSEGHELPDYAPKTSREKQEVLEQELDYCKSLSEGQRHAVLLRSLHLTSRDIAEELSDDSKTVTQNQVEHFLHYHLARNLVTINEVHLRDLVKKLDPIALEEEVEKRGLLIIGDEVLSKEQSEIVLLTGAGLKPFEISHLLNIDYSSLRARLSYTIYNNMGVWNAREAGNLVRSLFREKVLRKAEEYGLDVLIIGDVLLRDTEKQILLMLGAGFSQKEIADKLGIPYVNIRDRLHSTTLPKFDLHYVEDLGALARKECGDLVQETANRNGKDILIVNGEVVFGQTLEIMHQLARGASLQTIAANLGISYDALRSRLGSTIYPKLGINGLGDLSALAKKYLTSSESI